MSRMNNIIFAQFDQIFVELCTCHKQLWNCERTKNSCGIVNIPLTAVEFVHMPHSCNQTCSAIKDVKGFRHQIESDVSLQGVRHFTIEQFTKPTFGINSKTSDNQHKSTWKFETLEFYILR